MKLMKKVLVLALAAATIMLAACNNGNSGGSSSGVVSPTQSEGKGDDPFTGLETLTPPNDTTMRYLVDTTKKVLTKQISVDGGKTWNSTEEYSYSYGGTITPPTITIQIAALYDGEGKRFIPEELLATYETEFKKSFDQDFDQVSGLEDESKKQSQVDLINNITGLSLTVDDFSSDKKDETLEKVWNSEGYQNILKEGKESLQKALSITSTYAVTLTEKSGTTAKIAVEGQYDSELAWYDQTAGSFEGTSGTAEASFSNGSGSISSGNGDYQVTAVTTRDIICSGSTEPFAYTTTGSGKDTVVTITVDSQVIECKWQPSTTLTIG